MSLLRKSNNSGDASYLSSHHKVFHYLQNSTCQKASANDLFHIKQSFNNQHRLRSCSENDSISSSSRSDISVDSSLSDSVARCSTISSIASSSSEELDFNLGFDQINDDDFDEEDNQDILNKNNDTVTLLGESNSDVIEEFLDQSPIFNDEYEFNYDETITNNHTNQLRHTSFLHDSTNTLCSQERFSAYTDNDDQENEHSRNGLGICSNSLGIIQFNDKSTLVDEPPKKAVRFADMMGLDLESIRYMTPPEYSTNLLIQEYTPSKLEQLRLTRNQKSLPDIRSRSSSFTNSSKQYNLVSKHFSSPTEVIPIIYDQQIMLECLYTKDAKAYGTIRVHNCAYDKHVLVRLTEDEWITSNDIVARHSMNYSNDNTDTYTFEINLPKSNEDTITPKRILFAVSLQAMWQEFWDNNQGWNYVFDVLKRR